MVKVNKNFWRNKRVLITGHTGFKGGWLSLWLQDLGSEVVGYSLKPPTKPSLFEAAEVGKEMRSVDGDVRDLAKLTRVLRKEKPEIVIHLAGQPIVRLSYEDPILTYTTNVVGTVNLLEAVRNTPSVVSVVCITSDKCYENKGWVWGYREIDGLGGRDPYSSSKAGAELVISAYRSSFFAEGSGVALASARAGNVIGGGDWAKDRLVPDIVRGFGKKEEVLIRNPKSTRPWQHVMEPLSGYLMLAQKLYEKGGSFAEAWNFGPDGDNAKSVSYIANYLAKKWEKGAFWKTDGKVHPHEDMYLSLDNSKAKRKLGWYPRLSLDETLNWIVEWYRTYQCGRNVRAKTLEQINRYEKVRK
ncbi:CDP-glucose 4,6-dehydratase [Candidatus Woesebacteria bacterium RIFCSPHIGHO2_01_FULL_38_10]|uniref:CDP-glucose 4,6-dehydratase n=1 Tax=Candidatus Woesebacteria bacterium RIFCSPLOWO2_01_FULL_39_10b TaxID=1802517 RepID=A0A1F8B9R7_9BACT|nr:MAG: CDP-glucose 4,6-dehydratase [Candidatus Woesebacteria bacterium RIFCSPHIGHO2_01_FULL_38_10]OGM60680.1 MAG: CDP-glucose 4,6-dehydratase [Candidatus Woesebacteria bacterium RIFCSPLOWO2_01_FULL_39_10b]